MKEIEYNGNLEDDIYNAENEFNSKEFFFIAIICFVILATLANIYLFGLGFKIFTLLNLIKATTFMLIPYSAVTFIKYADSKRRISRKNTNANARLNVLSHDIDLDNDNKITKENILDAQIFKEMTNTKMLGQDEKVLSKEEKIAKYFYLLDNDDKIKVLKEIRSTLTMDNFKIESSHLFLLDNDEIDKKNYLVKKVLKTK